MLVGSIFGFKRVPALEIVMARQMSWAYETLHSGICTWGFSLRGHAQVLKKARDGMGDA